MLKRVHNYFIKFLVFLFLLASFAGQAQIKQASFTTGSGTNQIDLSITVNYTTNLVSFSMTGPSTKWFGYALDAVAMANGPYTILGNVASGNVAEYTMVAYAAPTLQITQNLNFVSSSITSGRKTINFTRALNTGDASDYIFLSSLSTLDIAWAYGGSTALTNHANRGSSVLTFVNPCAGIGSTLPTLHICNGDSVMIFGSYRKNAAIYRDTIPLASGCDSIISRVLVVHNAQTTNLASSSICQGDSILVFGKYIKQSGTYKDTLNSFYGCDSILSKTVNVRPKYNIDLGTVLLCNGDSLLLFGSYKKLAGTYTATYNTQYGCDSILSKTIQIKPTYFTNLGSQSICQGDSALIFGVYRKTAGTFVKSYLTALGCDSSFSKSLIVNPSYHINLGVYQRCSGDSVLFAGKYIKTAGIYYDSLQTNLGCDSIRFVQMQFNSSIVNNLGNMNLCFGDSVLLFGKMQKTSGTYRDTLTSLAGCDSILEKTLTVYPAIDTAVQLQQFTFTATSMADSYQWIDCLTNTDIAGAINQTFTATQNGQYRVKITKNNCIAFSSCWRIVGMGFAEQNGSILPKLYPNPVNDLLKIDLGYTSKKTHIKVVNINGQLLIDKVIFESKDVEIQLDNLSPAMYQLIIQTEEEIWNFKILKQ